jgi:hypothetical protein
MCYISYSKYIDEKNLVLGKNERIPPRDSYPRKLHENLEILIEETAQDKYSVQVLEKGRLIFPYKLVFDPPDNPKNLRSTIINLNNKLSNGVFHLKKGGNVYFFEDKMDMGSIIETIQFVKKKNRKFDLFWMIER